MTIIHNLGVCFNFFSLWITCIIKSNSVKEKQASKCQNLFSRAMKKIYGHQYICGSCL